MKLTDGLRRFLPADSRLGYALRRLYHRLTPAKPRPLHRSFLWVLSRQKREVSFVQVGSNDAGYGDPLRYHILHDGWRGLMIEPLPFVYSRLLDRYRGISGLQFANVAIDSEPGTRPFYHLRADDDPALPPWYDQLGSFLKENVLKHEKFLADLPERLTETAVRCERFDDLCAQQGIDHFDLLHVDAEGYDFEILRSVDFRRFSPLVVLYEHRHLSDEDTSACAAMLTQAGYQLFRDIDDTLAVSRALLDEPQMRKAWERMHELAQKQGSRG